jgi:hypothetical protein
MDVETPVQGAPETAINALDAAVAAYVNVSVLRQQIPGTHRVHGIISGSEGWSVNGEPKRTVFTLDPCSSYS